MFGRLQFGISASSHTRAGLVALSAHALVIGAAVYATERPIVVARASADTLRIELSQPDDASPTGAVPHPPLFPVAPSFPRPRSCPQEEQRYRSARSTSSRPSTTV